MLLNVQQMGFFKVNYDARNWDLIIAQLRQKHSVFHVINRAQVKKAASTRMHEVAASRNSSQLTMIFLTAYLPEALARPYLI